VLGIELVHKPANGPGIGAKERDSYGQDLGAGGRDEIVKLSPPQDPADGTRKIGQIFKLLSVFRVPEKVLIAEMVDRTALVPCISG
jgi:hypothetical protein